MLDQEAVENLQEQIAVHRRRLALRLRQRAVQGSAHVLPEVETDIEEARTIIQQLKKALLASGIVVTNHPNDDENTTSQSLQAPRDRLFHRTQIVWGIGFLILIGTILAGQFFFSSLSSNLVYSLPSPTELTALHSIVYEQQEGITDKSTSELINILNIHANHILEDMEEAKQKGLESIRSGQGYDSEDELIHEYESLRKTFIDLHNKNIQAIKDNQFTVSHELITDIHYLLWVKARNTFWGAYADRNSSYAVDFDPPETYADAYPGVLPDDITKLHPELAPVIQDTIKQEDELGMYLLDTERLQKIENMIGSN